MHTELIPLAGGRNARPTPPSTMMGMEEISLEQILAYDPDVVLVKETMVYARIRSDPRWRSLRAVREGRVLLIPSQPFNWFDRPPSFMRLLGLRWLAHALHPDRVPFDELAETRRFYRLFLGVELTEADAAEVLCR
jgi:iron complex transport system substrate-binding protein